MNSVSPERISPPSRVRERRDGAHLPPARARSYEPSSFLVNKSQDGERRGVGKAAWPPRGFDGSIPSPSLVTLGKEMLTILCIGVCESDGEGDGVRRGRETHELQNGSRGAMHVAAARHYRAPKHTSCIIPPMLLCFPRRWAPLPYPGTLR